MTRRFKGQRPKGRDRRCQANGQRSTNPLQLTPDAAKIALQPVQPPGGFIDAPVERDRAHGKVGPQGANDCRHMSDHPLDLWFQDRRSDRAIR